MNRRLLFVCWFVLAGCYVPDAVSAQEEAGAVAATSEVDLWTTEVAIDTLWTLMAAFLVFFMNAGFGCAQTHLSNKASSGRSTASCCQGDT